jgi:PAS domain-containing protein
MSRTRRTGAEANPAQIDDSLIPEIARSDSLEDAHSHGESTAHSPKRVDTASDHGGRVTMLRRAQDWLRHGKASREAILLNALPAPVAVLDGRGRIVSVNDAWQRFQDAEAIQVLRPEVGRNYLEIFDRAPNSELLGTHPIAAGIRSVLAGAASNFSMDYVCDSSTEPRWFELTVTRLGGAGTTRGAIVMQQDITQRKQALKALKDSRQRLDRLVMAATDAILTFDADLRLVLSNPAAENMFGYTSAELRGQPLDLLVPAHFRSSHSRDIAIFGEASINARRMGATRPVIESRPRSPSLTQADGAILPPCCAILPIASDSPTSCASVNVA